MKQALGSQKIDYRREAIYWAWKYIIYVHAETNKRDKYTEKFIRETADILGENLFPEPCELHPDGKPDEYHEELFCVYCGRVWLDRYEQTRKLLLKGY